MVRHFKYNGTKKVYCLDFFFGLEDTNIIIIILFFTPP